MKKLKIYFLILLVPLLLMGCIEKGVSTTITTGTTSTFSELQAMIDGSKLDGSSLIDNQTDLTYLKSKVAGDTNSTVAINTLSSYLTNNVQIPILSSSSSFVYSTAVTNCSTYDNTIINNLGVYTYDELVSLQEALETLNSIDSTVLLIIAKLDVTLNAIKSRKAVNPFYSTAYLLYTQYINYIGKTSYKFYLSDTIGFDIDDFLTNSSSISDTYNILLAEISNLSSNTNTFIEKSTLQTYLNLVRQAYYAYLYTNGSYADITDARAALRVYENTVLSNSTLVNYYSDKIDDIYLYLSTKTGLDASDSALVTGILSHINAYKERNNQFTNSNYLVIHSKVTNIVEEYKYLKSKEAYLSVTLGYTF